MVAEVECNTFEKLLNVDANHWRFGFSLSLYVTGTYTFYNVQVVELRILAMNVTIDLNAKIKLDDITGADGVVVLDYLVTIDTHRLDAELLLHYCNNNNCSKLFTQKLILSSASVNNVCHIVTTNLTTKNQRESMFACSVQYAW